MKNQAPNILGALFTCIVAGAAGCSGKIFTEVAVGVAGDLASNIGANRLDPFFLQMMQRICSGQARPTERPLVQALRDASLKATRDLQILFKKKLEREYSSASIGIVDVRMKRATHFFEALQQAVADVFNLKSMSAAEVLDQSTSDFEQASERLQIALRFELQQSKRKADGFFQQFFSHKEMPTETDLQELEDFFVQAYPAQLEICIDHALGENAAARSTLLRVMLTDLKQGQGTLIGGQAEMKSILIEILQKVLNGKSEPAALPKALNFIPELEDLETEAIGREEDIDKLHDLLSVNKSVAVVRGIGGMGKTTLARAYVTKYGDTYDHLVWLSESDKLVSACSNATILHQNLGLPFTDEPEEARFSQTMSALREITGNNLLLLDNAAANLAKQTLQNKPLHHYLPGSNWKKLATSRERISKFKEFELTKLPHDAALKLFEEHYGKVEESKLTKLFETVDYHTLTIEILAKTLHAYKGSLTIDRLQDALGKHQLHDAAIQHKIELEHQGSEAGIYLHLLDTFDVAALSPDTDAYRVLQHFLLLPPEGMTEGRGHPFSFLKEALVPHATADDRSLSEALDLLCDLGWLTEEQDFHFSLHRMLWEVLLYKIKPSEKEAEGFIKHITSFLGFDSSTNFTLLFPYIKYGDAILEIFGNSDHETISVLKNELGVVYQKSGNYSEAAALLVETLQSTVKNFGKDHTNVAASQSNLAIVYSDLGQYNEAAELLEEALQSDLKNFGKEHPTVAVRQSNLAIVYQNLGQYIQAAKLLEEALKSNMKNFRNDHPSFTASQANLANVYKDMKRHKEAAELLEEALQSDQENFGKDHPIVTANQANLANVYKYLGRYNEAVELNEEALKSALKNFGKEHPSVAVCQSNLGSVYKHLGRYNEAVELLEEALQSDLKNYGKEHPNVAINLSNLAQVYRKQKEWGQALPLFEQAHGILLQLLGEDHPHTKSVVKSIAYVREQMGGKDGD